MKHVLLASALVAASTAAAFAQGDRPEAGAPPGGRGTAPADAAPQAPAGQAPTGRGPAAPAPSGAASVTACRPMIVPFGTRGTIEANINVATRLEFPVTVRRVEVSTPALWDATYAEHSAWVRPKTQVAVAGQTGLTVFLVNGRTLDFLVNASSTVPPSCVLVVEPPQPAAAQPSPASPPQQAPRTPEEAAGDREAAAARARAASASATRRRASEDARLAERFAAMRRQVEQQAMDRIKQFQHSIDTNYTWGGSGRGDQYLVQAVYDDGRFTYVRIKTDAFGVPAITGRVNGADTLLQYTYDDLTGVFTIQGLFDRLNLSLGTHSIPIRRRG